MRRTLPLLLALALLLVPASAAQAKTYRDLLSECGHTGQVSNPAEWTRAQYEEALNRMSAKQAEYTHCVSILQRARDAVAAVTRGSGSSSGSTPSTGGTVAPIGGGGGGPSTNTERAALDGAAHGSYVAPTSSTGVLAPLAHISATSVSHPLPSSLIALMVLLGAGIVLTTAPGLLQRVRLRRQR